MKLTSTMDALGTGAITAMLPTAADGRAHTSQPPIVTPTPLKTKGNTTIATLVTEIKNSRHLKISTLLSTHKLLLIPAFLIFYPCPTLNQMRMSLTGNSPHH
jgi:hypothetical protein